MTGFADARAERPAAMDWRAFVSLCHEAARLTRRRVVDMTPRNVTPNFHVAVLSGGPLDVAVLGHGDLPIIALARVPVTIPVIFADDDAALAQCLRHRPSVRLLTRRELDTPLCSYDVSDLDKAELRQIAYWRPETLGQLLFHHWD
ncbi:hypothetical protein IL992_26935 [Microbispora sp. NEAU-D428]|uniref:hypothetical protein n=1 Tax=Microbispora sitophila TaxID=2771537 RepID=UPI00186957F9|nr:hypothetical protein [Microbispora sitophila]MBE3012795.1 hypothetical protein [Microbispora sitophila]